MNRDKINAYLQHAVSQDLLDASNNGFVSMDTFSAWYAYDKANREEVASPKPVIEKEVLYYDEDGYVITM